MSVSREGQQISKKHWKSRITILSKPADIVNPRMKMISVKVVTKECFYPELVALRIWVARPISQATLVQRYDGYYRIVYVKLL